jgi:arylsulfatase A
VDESRPNVILINCDDLGYGDLGCYGSEINKTPALDKMASEGIRFTDFYSASSVCSPSRGAMLTGCFPRRIGFASFGGQWVLFPGQEFGLAPEEKTIATLLKERDYATMCIGKWHCGDQREFFPTHHGFDHYYGLPYSNDMGRQAGREDKWPPLPLLKDEEVLQEQPDQAALTERYVEQAVSFIRENHEKPFFLYLAHMYVHLPLYAPDRFMRESENGAYGAAVACVDWAVNVILDELKQHGVDENTLVIFTSDNGSRGDHGGSNAPLRGAKGSSWEGGYRVPCVMRWPGRIPEAQERRGMTSSIDLLPTICELTGASVPGDRIIDGRSMVPLFEENEVEPVIRDTFFYYFKDDLEGVRHGDWKLIVRRRGEIEPELYNLSKDVSETNNIYGANLEVAAELKKLLGACRQDLGDSAVGMEGAGCRPAGVAADPKPLTEYDPDHPYIIALYDLKDAG